MSNGELGYYNPLNDPMLVIHQDPKCDATLCSMLTSGGVCLHRFTEKGNLEVLLFTIQSKMRANNQKVYMPREGKLISDINKVWAAQDQTSNVFVNLEM